MVDEAPFAERRFGMHDALRFSVIGCVAVALTWRCSSCESDSSAPGTRWPSATPEEKGLDSGELAAVVERIDEQNLPIDSMLVVRGGVLVLDAYFFPYLGEQPHDVASVTKSVTSTLAGIAIDQGLLSLEQNVVSSFPDVDPGSPLGAKAEIEIHDLLSMSSGLDCGRRPGEPELYQMIASDDYVEYALQLPMTLAPGAEFAYCSPGSHLVSAMIADAAGQSAFEFALKHLFTPLGFGEAHWPEDPQGVNHGWGDLQLHPHDMARLGLLFLNEGAWNGTQIVSKEWVERATSHLVTADVDGTGYGYQWWALGGAFEGVYEARGRGGQAIIIWPDQDIVAVFTGRGVDVRGDIAPLLVAAVKSDGALDANPDALARLETAIENATAPPPAEPVPLLPPLAAEVSENTYRLAENQFDAKCVSLRFDSRSEVLFTLTLGSGAFDLPVGMDGVPRFSESGPTGIPVGVVGAWTEPSVFTMQYDEVAGPNHLVIRGAFEADAMSVALEFSDPAGHFPPQTVPGKLVDACD